VKADVLSSLINNHRFIIAQDHHDACRQHTKDAAVR